MPQAYHILSYPIVSYRILSYSIYLIVSYHTISYHIIPSYLILPQRAYSARDHILMDNYIMFAMLRRFGSPTFRFSQMKHFLDTRYKNVTIIGMDTPGALSRMSNVFSSYGVNLTYLRTHFQNLRKGNNITYRIEVSLDAQHDTYFEKAKHDLNLMGLTLTEADPIQVPWFPRNHKDVDLIGKVLLDVKESKDHSQFKDLEYVERRDFIATVAKEFKMGQNIPNIKYDQAQTDLWTSIYKRISVLHRQAMCQKFLANIEELQKEMNISKRIPQLDELSAYLKKKSGFTIKPTHGILSQREFLNSLAFKIFCSTQYLRNVKNPDYTPEPDIIHQILGHVPMFADPQVAQISQTIGLLSLGATDEEVSKLGSLYWFTMQFGVCKENGKIKGYGAGVGSSIGEIENMLGRGPAQPRFERLSIFKDCVAAYPVQTVQPLYKVVEDFDFALTELQRYGRYIMKPITTVYNQEKECIMYDRHISATETEDMGPKF